MSQLTCEELTLLTISEIQNLVQEKLTVSWAHHNHKDPLVDFVLTEASPELLASLRLAIDNKVAQKALVRERNLVERKRKRQEEQTSRCVAAKLDQILEEVRDPSKFLELPNDNRVKECYREFYKATSNKALTLVVCAVCAREVNMEGDHVHVYQMTDLPHSNRLIPTHPHPCHDLFQGRLLEPKGVIEDSGTQTQVRVCGNCFSELREESANETPPRLSLANNLWIGRIPWQLEVLTFPEQLLIALLYPCVYVFKLFPKDVNYRPDASTLQRGMRGTVSTYDLDMEGAASMIQGNLLPRSMTILPSIISVTFISRGELPKRWLQSTF